MTGLRERKKTASWYAIRDNALRLFDQRGFESVTVDEIAAEANLSRATFFTYFPSKEAVVFANAPDEREAWQELMDACPTDMPIWQALSRVLIGFNERLTEILPLRRRLKERSPVLAQSSDALGPQFQDDLRRWVMERRQAGTDERRARLLVNLALAASTTAYQSWDRDEPFDAYLGLLSTCLREAGEGVDRNAAGRAMGAGGGAEGARGERRG